MLRTSVRTFLKHFIRIHVIIIIISTDNVCVCAQHGSGYDWIWTTTENGLINWLWRDETNVEQRRQKKNITKQFVRRENKRVLSRIIGVWVLNSIWINYIAALHRHMRVNKSTFIWIWIRFFCAISCTILAQERIAWDTTRGRIDDSCRISNLFTRDALLSVVRRHN